LFWIEVLLALGNALLLVMTVLWKEWIEIVFGVDPDAGSGSVEWAIVGITLLLTVVFLSLATRTWRGNERWSPSPQSK
jgi:hypothetical protein